MYAHFVNGYEVLNTPKEEAFIKDNYPLAQNISVDYAILEKAQNVFVLPATFDWNDLGTWGSLHDKLEKDEQNNAIVNATVVLENASNNIIRTEGKKVVVIDGLNDYIVVDQGNTLLIYPKSKEQDIKTIVQSIKN
jgi:mannose-1-phosphate guanylyltransferase